MISLYSPKSEFMLAAAEIAKAGLMNAVSVLGLWGSIGLLLVWGLK